MKHPNYSPLLLSVVMMACVACGKTSDATSTIPTVPTNKEKTANKVTKTVSVPSDNDSLTESDEPFNLLKADDDGSLGEESSNNNTTRAITNTAPNDAVGQSDGDNNVLSGSSLEPDVGVARRGTLPIEYEEEWVDVSEDEVFDSLAPESTVAEMKIEELDLLKPELTATDDDNILEVNPLEPELLLRPAPELVPDPGGIILLPQDEPNILSTEPLDLAPRLEPIAPLPEEETNVLSTEPLERELGTPMR